MGMGLTRTRISIFFSGFELEVAVINALPAPTAVITPLLIVATSSLLLFHSMLLSVVFEGKILNLTVDLAPLESKM
jgi:hypothetical protein